MNPYILLTQLSPEDFGLTTTKEIEEALAEFGCKALISKNIKGDDVIYATAPKLRVMSNMCENVDLPGIVVKYTDIFDQFVEM